MNAKLFYKENDMTVWVLMGVPFMGKDSTVLGVYSSEARAFAAMNEFDQHHYFDLELLEEFLD